MRRLIFLLVLLLLPIRAMANICAAAATGNWNAAATWTSCGGTYPGAGGANLDTATIGSAFVVTIPASFTANAGLNGATGTAAVTLSGTAQLIINGTLDARGDLVQQQGTTVIGNGGGTLILDAATSTQRLWQCNNTGSGNSSAVINGTAWTAGNFFTVNGSGGQGGKNGLVDFYNGGLCSHRVTFNYAILKNLGDSTAGDYAYRTYERGAVPDYMHHVVWIADGEVVTSLNSNTLDWNAVDFRGSVDGPDGAWVLNCDASIVSRVASNITLYDTGAGAPIAVNCGNLSASNWIAYDAELQFNFAADNTQTYSGFIFAIDNNTLGAYLQLTGQNNQTVKNSVFLTAPTSSSHDVNEAGSGALGTNIVSNIVYDGSSGLGNVCGDFYLPSVSGKQINNLLVNQPCSMAGLLNATTVLTSNNNTDVGTTNTFAGISVGETTGAATQVQQTENNIFANQSKGFIQNPAMVSQSGWTLDYTEYWNMTGSNITHPVFGNNSYLAPATYAAWWSSGSFGQNGKGLHDINVNPQFRNTSGSVLTYGGWATVQVAARELVSINGIDYTGAATTATTKTAATILSYMQFQFTPMNGALKNAGAPSLCTTGNALTCDVGAVPVYPATAQVIF